MALDTGGDEQAAGVRPGDDLVLTPPPGYNDGDVKSKDKCDRYQVCKPLAVQTDLLKLDFACVIETKSVCEGEHVIQQ